jgi:hypothetical protein
MRLPLSLIVIVAAASQVGATDCGQITRDQGFDLWCGEELCTWKLERGKLMRVGTWNDKDPGVELVGDDVAIAQLTPVTSSDTTCIRFELVADVSEDAEVRLNADVFGDGSVEFSERLPTSHWKPLSFLIPVRAPYDGVRFELTKRGKGKAVVAQLQAETAGAAECDGFTEVVPEPAPAGARCAMDDQCESGMCRYVAVSGGFGLAQLCVDCDTLLGTAEACPQGQVCGVDDALSRVLLPAPRCTAKASKLVGDDCRIDGECASGICNSFVCSTCDTGAPCLTEACAEAYANGPYVCGAGQHARTTGQVCATDGDCASARCIGDARKQCVDGRACTTPEQCPDDDGLAPGDCTEVGVEGGRCQ